MLQTLGGIILFTEKQTKSEARLGEAESLFLECRPLFVRHYGEDHGSTISADSNLAQLAAFRGDLSGAESLFADILEHHRRIGSSKDVEMGALLRIASIKLATGRSAEAEAIFDQVLVTGRSIWDTNDFRYKKLIKDVEMARSPLELIIR